MLDWQVWRPFGRDIIHSPSLSFSLPDCYQLLANPGDDDAAYTMTWLVVNDYSFILKWIKTHTNSKYCRISIYNVGLMQSYIPSNRLSAGGKLGSNRPTSEVYKSVWKLVCISLWRYMNDVLIFLVSVLLASFSASDEIVNIWSILNGTLDHVVRTVLHRHSDDPQTFCAIVTLNCGIVDMCQQ